MPQGYNMQCAANNNYALHIDDDDMEKQTHSNNNNNNNSNNNTNNWTLCMTNNPNGKSVDA